MINSVQSEKYTQLHKWLFEVHTKREEHKKNIVHFASLMKGLFDRFDDQRKILETKSRDNVVTQFLYQQQEDELMKLLETYKALTLRVSDYLKEGLVCNRHIDELMKEMIKQNKVISSATITSKKVTVILKELQSGIRTVEMELEENIKALRLFSEELEQLEQVIENIVLSRTAAEGQRFDLFYALNKDKIPAEQAKIYEKDYHKLHFFLDIFTPWHTEAKEQLQNLSRQLFPEAAEQQHKTIKQYIDAAAAQRANDLILHMYNLVSDMRSGVSMIEKYGAEKIESWRSFYCKPAVPKLRTWQEEKENYEWFTDEEIEVRVKKENERTIIYHNWQEKRKAIWYDAMQPLNFKWLPELNELEGDYWVLYAVNMWDDYDRWHTAMEKIETVIDYEMDPDLLFKPYKEFSEQHLKKFNEFHGRASAKRDKLIFGE